jgi:hypothetical protein
MPNMRQSRLYCGPARVLADDRVALGVTSGSTEGARFISPRAKPWGSGHAPATTKAPTGRDKNAVAYAPCTRLVGHGTERRPLFHPVGVSDDVCAGTYTRAAPWPGESDPVGVGKRGGDMGLRAAASRASRGGRRTAAALGTLILTFHPTEL